MPQYTIQLTTEGLSSGPNYDVYWSLDCVNYNLLTGSTPVNLPNVGSSVTVTLPDGVACVKLQNINSQCNNEVIKQIGTPSTTTTTDAPTTTTTTISGSTTTTTTTEQPTTTTTTTESPTTTTTSTTSTTTTTTTTEPTTTTTTSTTSTTTTTTTTAAPTTTTTTEGFVFYNATQYLNCVQNSAPGAYELRVPLSLDSGTWWCGDDGFQYQFDSNTASTTYDVTATSNASPSACANLAC